MLRWIAIIVLILVILVAADYWFALFNGSFSGIFGLEPEGIVVTDDAVVDPAVDPAVDPEVGTDPAPSE
ncbi:hypothetical protein [Pseudoroseicyclus sp. CXY001]|uniref:hypothetical protein n=1 Tax=Pseudoroseicyclus sp. CXY001 TaxID=3242492 RepID=UPI003570E5D2